MIDPFAHLHDEGYARPFDAGRVGWRELVEINGRRAVSLDGTWKFTPDLYDEGLRQKWYGFARDPAGQWDWPRDYDEEAAYDMAVPSCWNLARPEWMYFEGSGWYARDFRPPLGERVFLHLGGANYETRVFVNGVFAGGHRGGSTPFSVELTAHLAAGVNHLLIQVENRRRSDRVPMNHNDWFNYGGLYREVSLLALPEVFIRRFTVGLAKARLDRIAVHVVLSESVDGVAEVDVGDVRLRVPVVGGEGRAEVEAAVRLWAPEDPFLYDVVVRFGADRVADRVGFREIRTEGERILLNGRAIYLRGVCVHEDDALTGKTSDEADIRRRFADAKAMGANFLRLSHYPHHDLVARIADEVGLMLWAEVPVYWAIDFANPDTYADAENQLLELIVRDANRASVIAWGVGNENADTEARYLFMSRLAGAARGMDPSRLIAAACLINRERFAIEDRLADHLDLIGINEYFGWYERDFSGLERLLANSRPGKPVVISEVGADALAGYRGRGDELFTEDCQAEIFRRQLAIVDTAEYVQGFCPWVLYDYRTERRQTRFQKGWNRKGLIGADKATRKLAFDVLADHYGRLRDRNR
jgi:beta-glucuronidase